MTKLESFFDSFFPILGIIFVIVLALVIIGSIGYTHDRYDLKNIDVDKTYFFNTKVVDSHTILLVSERFDDKSFQVIDLGEVKVEAK